MRKIIHIDMDAFYASIEQRDNPTLKGKPVVVGYSGERGVVAAASYEARKYGVHSAMPSQTALKKCPGLIFLPARFNVYRRVSRVIRNIFLDYTNIMEPLSLDEAYLDVTTNKKNISSATLIAREIKKIIKERTDLTASAGVSINKFLAKIASDYKKPDGLFVIKPAMAEAFVEELKIEKFWGVGKVTAHKMHELGIYTGRDLKKFTQAELCANFGKMGAVFYQNARAQDTRPVEADRARKSTGAENTFAADTGDMAELSAYLEETAQELWRRVEKSGFGGRTLTLKIKYVDFRVITRSKSAVENIKNYALFLKTARELLGKLAKEEEFKKKKVRLLGLSLSSAETEEETGQLDFGFNG